MRASLLCIAAIAVAHNDHNHDKYSGTQGLSAEGRPHDYASISADARSHDNADGAIVGEQLNLKEAYPPPPGWRYATNATEVPGKLNVHIVPHSHDDTGWLMTVDQYYDAEVSYMFDTVIQSLQDDPNRRFIEVETGFFARWWQAVPETKRAQVRELVARGALEFVNGGWCMHDEASPLYVSMVDQTTRGHQFIRRNFNGTVPTATWQVDPFGHSNTEAWLLGAEAGFDSLFFGRMDNQDFNHRKAHPETQGLEWMWRGSRSVQNTDIFTGMLYGSGGGGYGAPSGLSFDSITSFGQSIQDDPRRNGWNVPKWIEKVNEIALEQATHFRTNNIMWAMGTDFNYQNADHWYRNLDKLIHYANLNGTVNLLYSTPSQYAAAKRRANVSTPWEVRMDDIFPLADNAHHYWSGYFTSRPALKFLERDSSALLNAARVLEAADPRNASVVGTTDDLEAAVALTTHHDAMSGTEKQAVNDDYEQRISMARAKVQAYMASALARISGGSDAADGDSLHMCDMLNASFCTATANEPLSAGAAGGVRVVAFNSLAHVRSEVLRVPVQLTAPDAVTVTDATGAEVPAQLIPIAAADVALSKMYLSLKDRLNATKVRAATNHATHIVVFRADLLPLGVASFNIELSVRPAAGAPSTIVSTQLMPSAQPATASSDHYQLDFDGDTGMISRITNIKTNVSAALQLDIGFYASSTGGCTAELPGPPTSEAKCDGQKSGAYIFRPNSSALFYPSGTGKAPQTVPTVSVVTGKLVTEVRQSWSDWASVTLRLAQGQPYVEVEWTVGPIPSEGNTSKVLPAFQQLGREVVLRYNSDLASASTFVADANGRETVTRVRDARGRSYPPLNISEPIAGNYYPINSFVGIEDAQTNRGLAVLTDRTQGGSSIKDGSLELMVHRRTVADDSRGVGEALSESMCGCRAGLPTCLCGGLVVRGKHFVVLDSTAAVRETRRTLSERLNNKPVLAFGRGNAAVGAAAQPSSLIAAALPLNVKLLTLKNMPAEDGHSGGMLLRLAHLYEAGESDTLSLPATVSLARVFAAATFKLVAAEEWTLTANQPLATLQAARAKLSPWKVSDKYATTAIAHVPFNSTDASFNVTLAPMAVRTFIVHFAQRQ